MDIPQEVKEILDRVKLYVHNHKGKITFYDYERFKHELQDKGWFGYESYLADILGV